MIRIAICDDDKNLVAKIEDRLEKNGSENLLKLSIDAFYSGESLEETYNNGERYDIIYLDIEMQSLNGIQVAKLIREKDKYVIIIYISSHEEYLIQLFDVEPFRFIKKPINLKLFDRYFREAYEKILTSGSYFEFDFNRSTVKILYSDIIYFESRGRCVYIIQKDKEDKFIGKLNSVEEKVAESNNPFLRIHQSYLVNFHYIKKICYSKIELYDGKILLISEERQKIIREKYSRILKGL